jgi:hypothetical protein
MKKLLTVLASLCVLAGPVAASHASIDPAQPAPTFEATEGKGVLDALKTGDRLDSAGLKALGVKKLKGKKLATAQNLQAEANAQGEFGTQRVGTYYWYSWQYTDWFWVDTYYDFSYYSGDYYYYTVFDNYKVCTLSGTGCIAAGAYTYYYLLYYYGSWYYYGPYGPYAG